MTEIGQLLSAAGSTLTPSAIVAAIGAGTAFGLALPWLFTQLTRGIIPDVYIVALNRAALVLVPGLALPLLSVLWLSQIVIEVETGGPWERLVGRAITSFIFVGAVTLADLLAQRLWPSSAEHAVTEHVAELDNEAEATRRRTVALRRERLAVELDTRGRK